MDFLVGWSYISRIRLILWLNAIIERSLLLLSLLEALTPQSPLRFEDLYWARLIFWLSPRPSLLLFECQAKLLFYHHSHLPPLHHLTLRHCYLLIPRERGTPQMVAEGAVEGMIANHSLHVSIDDRLIIVLIVVGRSLANLIGLPIMHLLMLLLLHPWLWWLYLKKIMIVLSKLSSSGSLVASCIHLRLKYWLTCLFVRLLDHWLKGICPYFRCTIPTYSLIQIIATLLCFYCVWSCLSYCGIWWGQSDLLIPVISSPLCSQFSCQPLIYQRHHQRIIFVYLILSLLLHLLGFAYEEED